MHSNKTVWGFHVVQRAVTKDEDKKKEILSVKWS